MFFPFWLSFAITCGVAYSPSAASVAIIVACSSRVSDPWPSASPDSCSNCGGEAACTSTPNALAMSITVLPPTRCHRSVYALLIDGAIAWATLTGGKCPWVSLLITWSPYGVFCGQPLSRVLFDAIDGTFG